MSSRCAFYWGANHSNVGVLSASGHRAACTEIDYVCRCGVPTENLIEPGAKRIKRPSLIGRPATPDVRPTNMTLDHMIQAPVNHVAADSQARRYPRGGVRRRSWGSPTPCDQLQGREGLAAAL